MSETALPIRTEADATEKVQVRILDKTTDANQLQVEANGNAMVKVHGQNPASADVILKLSELGNANEDGIYDATNNSLPSTSGLMAVQRATTPAASDQIKHISAISSGTVHALDVSLHDASGNVFNSGNPLAVTVVDAASGTPVNDYKKAAAVASAGSDNHDYTVAGSILIFKRVIGSSAGKASMEIQIDPTGSAGYSTVGFLFNSVSTPTMLFELEPADVAVGGKIRVIMKNLEPGHSEDLHSTILGTKV